MRIRVIDLVGEDAITLQDGQGVYAEIVPVLQDGDTVELDFESVKVFASPFFNAAIGQLLGDFSADDLNQRLRVMNLNPLGHDVLRQVIDNAKRYHTDPSYRKAADEVLQALSEDA